MLVSSASRLAPEALAIALAKGVKHAKRTFLGAVKAQAFQVRAPEGVEPFAYAPLLSGAFVLRVVLKGDEKEAGQVYNVTETHMAKGVAKLLAMDPAAFGRVSEGKGKVSDCVALVQLVTFGYERFDSAA